MKCLKHVPADATEAIQSCGHGPVKIKFSLDGSTVSLSSPSKYVASASVASLDILARLSVAPNTVHEVKAADVASCGLPFLYIRVDNNATVTSARVSNSATRSILEELAAQYSGDDRFVGIGIVPYWIDPKLSPEDEVIVHQRVFGRNRAEDPATGSASIASVISSFTFLECDLLKISDARQSLVLHDQGLLPHPDQLLSTTLKSDGQQLGEVKYTVFQGAEMGRPSVLKSRVLLHEVNVNDSLSKSWQVREAWIGGAVVKVAEGTISVPDTAE